VVVGGDDADHLKLIQESSPTMRRRTRSERRVRPGQGWRIISC
jgi:hypothetical protein